MLPRCRAHAGSCVLRKGGSAMSGMRRVGASRWWSVLAVAVALAGLSACEPDKPAGPAGRFVYDAAGRLAGVVDPADQAAVYRYDSLSNLVSVHRYPASELGVMAVVPAAARPGEMVRISGTGFSASSGSNAVTFGGTAAVVTSAAMDELRVTVPAGAGGQVSVAVAGKTSAWQGSFRVIGPPPAISGLSSNIGDPGATFTITGSGFDADPLRDDVWVGGIQATVASASTSSLLVRIPPGAAVGPVSVATDAGVSNAADPTSGPMFTVRPAGAPAGAAPVVGQIGTVVNTPGPSLVSFPVESGRVYQVAQCPVGVTAQTVVEADGSSTSVPCGGYWVARFRSVEVVTATQRKSWVQFPVPSGGGQVRFDDCTGAAGCVPPSKEHQANKLYVICECLKMKLWSIFDRVFGGDLASGGDPVDLGTGSFYEPHLDLEVGDQRGSVNLTRYYSTSMGGIGTFGAAGDSNLDIHLTGTCQANTAMYLVLPGQGRVRFDRFIGAGVDGSEGCSNITSPLTGTIHDQLVATEVGAPWFGSILSWQGDMKGSPSTTYAILTRPDGLELRFDASGMVTAITDRLGNTTSFTYLARPAGALSPALDHVTSPSGRWISFGYDSACLTTNEPCPVTSASDSAGQAVTYQYDSSKRLVSFTDAAGKGWEFRYEDAANPTFRTKTIALADSDFPATTMVDTHYASGRVDSQLVAGPNSNAQQLTFSYTTDAAGKVTTATETMATGRVRHLVFDPDGYVTSETDNVGTAAESSLHYVRNARHDVTSTQWADSTGATQVTEAVTFDRDGIAFTPSGSAPADDAIAWKSVVTTQDGASYTTTADFRTPWLYGLFGAIHRPGGGTTQLSYDSESRLSRLVNPDGLAARFTYAPDGLMASVSDDTSAHTAAFKYRHGLVASYTTPGGATSAAIAGPTGQPLVSTGPQGERTTYRWDPVGRPSSMTDPVGNTTTDTWSRWGPKSHTDAAGGRTAIDVAAGGYVKAWTDPYNKTSSVTYLDDGRLASTTSRTNKTTAFTYNPATKRLASVGYGRQGSPGAYTYESTIAYGYDDAGRVNALTDSTGGSVSAVFDDLDRLRSETSPAGTVTYTYSAASGRLDTVTGPGTSAAYHWSSGGHLNDVASAATVGFAADPQTGAPKTITYPGGVTRSVTATDADGRPTAVKTTGLTAGTATVNYTYDPSGRLVTTSGDDTQILVPNGQDQVTFTPVANGAPGAYGSRIVKLGDKPQVYDDSGRLTDDGINTYTWNARNELTEVHKKADGSLLQAMSYDALGRRRTITSGPATTRYLWDGDTVLQEQTAAGAATASNVIAATDSIVARTTSSGTESVIAGWSGSTRRTASGSTSTGTYQYTPAGMSSYTPAGAANPIPNRYIGRDQDPSGLVYLRARYLNPATHRFLSEDPLADGPNPYSYANNDAINNSDPSGLAIGADTAAACVGGGIFGGLAEAVMNPKAGWKDIAGAAFKGCVIGAAVTFAPWLVNEWVFGTTTTTAATEVAAVTTADGSAAASAPEGVLTPRPRFRTGTVDDAWANATPGPSGGRLCPTCGDEVRVPPRSGPRDWDIDHQPPWSQRTGPLSENPDLTRAEVIDEYQRGTRLECPRCNRGRGARPL